ncbi:hypothetical protein [Streptomyces sp. NPDC018693]|uniref:hypothetical protein n=1 Tax=unclassified Streptomyces TaxID=2593676 RepID=UPI0037A02B44
MPRTTPPRPLGITAHFPELASLARGATRLHPRAGEPTREDSSVGGPLLTVDGHEGDGSWAPFEDQAPGKPCYRGWAESTHLTIGRGYSLQLYVCVASYEHPHIQNMH